MFSKLPLSAPRDEGRSVYERALGKDFADLQPDLRTYFGSIPSGFEGAGFGTYSDAGLRLTALKPLFAVLGLRHIAFPDYGEDVPFTVRNVPGSDGTLRATRRFHFPHATRTMVDSMRVVDGRLVDRIGTAGEIEAEFELAVVDGRLCMVSRRLALRVLGIRFPLPQIMTVTLQEEMREDGTQRVELRVTTPLLGEIYGYAGTFRYALREVDSRATMTG